MRRPSGRLRAPAVATALILAAAALAEEAKISPEDLPEAVLAAVRGRFGGARLVGAEGRRRAERLSSR